MFEEFSVRLEASSGAWMSVAGVSKMMVFDQKISSWVWIRIPDLNRIQQQLWIRIQILQNVWIWIRKYGSETL